MLPAFIFFAGRFCTIRIWYGFFLSNPQTVSNYALQRLLIQDKYFNLCIFPYCRYIWNLFYISLSIFLPIELTLKPIQSKWTIFLTGFNCTMIGKNTLCRPYPKFQRTINPSITTAKLLNYFSILDPKFRKFTT